MINIVQEFKISGKILEIFPYGGGHINSTFMVKTTEKTYILQKMNGFVFKDLDALMNNIFIVTEHLKKKNIETLSVIKTVNDEIYLNADEGCYRMFEFIDNTITYQNVEDSKVFYNMGKAFGDFQNYLSDFDASKLVEVIPHFHDTPKRFEDFKLALQKNICDRAKFCQDEINFILSKADTFSKIVDGIKDKTIPLRVTHNDTKANNILMDAVTHEARAVIDLDTIMPGSMLYDFGDSIRSGASTAEEDEKDLNKITLDMELFKAYSEGFYSAVKKSITKREKELMPYSAYLITIELAMRFLGDYLSGDVYFSAKYEGHNLIRARAQLKLASEIEKKFDECNKIIESL